MALFMVGFTLVPNIKAQEAGEEETLLVAPTPVCAKSGPAAVALVASQHADKITASDGATLVTHIFQINGTP